MDSIEKLYNQIELNEGIFDKLLGKNKQSQETNYLQKAKGAGYYLNGNYVYSMYGDGRINPLFQNVWKLPKYKWLLDSKFKASVISLSEDGVSFMGKWYEGEFLGYRFSSGNDVLFLGGTFNGKIYDAANHTFKVEPQNYINGLFLDYKNGILGRELYKNNIQNTNSFIEIIRIPDNWVVTIKGDDNKKLSFKVLKKIDDKNTNFVFEIITTNEKKMVNWESIRNNYEKFGYIQKGGNFGLFGKNLFIKNIKSIVLEQTVVSGNGISNSMVGNAGVINFSLDKRLKSFVLAKNNKPFTFQVDTKNAIANNFIEIFQRDLEDGNFYRLLNKFKLQIEYGFVNGFVSAKYIHLASLFNNDKGTILEKDIQPEVADILAYFNNFMEFVVEGSSNNGIKKQIISSMKKFLNLTNGVIKPNIKQNVAPTNQQTQQKIKNIIP